MSNNNYYSSGEIDNKIFDEIDGEIRVEISDSIDLNANIINTSPISVDVASSIDLNVNVVNSTPLEVNVVNPEPISVINKDYAGRIQGNTIFAEGITANVNWEFNSNFAYQGDNRKLQQAITNGGTVGLSNSRLMVSSGTNPNGTAYASSKRALRYRAGQEGITGFTFMIPNRVVGNDRYIGLMDSENGFAFGIRDMHFGIFYKRGGVLTFIPQSTFNIDKIDGTGKSGFNINTEKLNIGRITYAYFGIAPPTFEVYKFGVGFVPVHSMDFINNSTEPHISLPYIRFGAYNINNGNTTNVSLYSASLAVGVIGGNDKDISTRNFVYASPTFTIATGTISGIPNQQRLLVIQNKATYGIVPVTNKIESLLNLLSATVLSANKQVTLKRYRLAVTPTVATWTDQSVNSIMRYSTNAIIDLTGAELTLSIELGTSDKFFETSKIEALDLRSQPTDCVAYVLETTSSTGEVKLSVGWKELF